MTAPSYASGLSKGTRYRLSVASRVVAAIVGGYALASALVVLLTLVAPVEPARMFAKQLAIFPIHVGILMWVFHTRSATRTWVWLSVWTAAVYAVCWLLGARP